MGREQGPNSGCSCFLFCDLEQTSLSLCPISSRVMWRCFECLDRTFQTQGLGAVKRWRMLAWAGKYELFPWSFPQGK